ncbi:MAG TPA: PBP1A family penicillin-binding protein [Desulfosporosinus sp.]|nr:PBP1A family penicillin-binding protein [Desulfosporosinus sp.]
MPSSKKPPKPKRQKRLSKGRIVLLSLVSVMTLILISLAIFIGFAAASTPEWDPAALQDQKQTSLIFDMNNTHFASLHGEENRRTAKSADIPDLVKKTFVAVEDKRFYEHFGVDPIRILGSALNDIRSGSAKEGASTITIQLARNAFIGVEDRTAKNLTRKVQEAIIAIQLEHEYTKDEILTFYLNQTFLGGTTFGIQAATKTYFGEELKDLTPDQVALLAGLPQAPSQYNPYFHPEAAKNRRAIVLGVMRDASIITAPEYDTFKETPFTYVDTMNKDFGGAQTTAVAGTTDKYPAFVNTVIAELENDYSITEDQIYNGGLQIYTTVNPKIQESVEAQFANPANFPKSFDSIPVQGAMTVIDPSTGAIQAVSGGRDYKPGNRNRSTDAKRPPGSTIKPLVVYGPAIEQGGYFPGTVLDDMPVTFPGNYSPTDFDTISKGWKGLITMRYALEDSVNVYAVKLLNLIGIDAGYNFAKDKLGLPLDDSARVLSLALGTPSLSTLDMASAYGVYANNGVRVTTHAIVKVLDSNGKNLITPTITKNRVMKETTAYIINDMLRSVVTNGTGTSARIGNWAIAGKTGTTSLDPEYYGNKSGNPDAWFAGYTSNYAAVVWMGYDKDTDREHYLHQVHGGSFPAQIWKNVMTVALQDLPVQSKFPMPAGIVRGSFDAKSGLRPSSLTPTQFIKTEIAAQGDFPTRVSDIWIQKNVDATDPSMLASPTSKNFVAKTFLNLPGRNRSWTWPSSEAPYKPPTAVAPDTVVVPDPPTLPPAVDPALPSPTLGSKIKYNKETFKAVVPMTVPPENKGDSTIFYLKRPDKTVLEIPINAANAESTSITITLDANDQPPDSGDYVFTAAFKNRNGVGTGPVSDPVTLTIK